MIKAESQLPRFQVLFTNGEHQAFADTTQDKGGSNLGFRPHELLEAALATCMNMSLRMGAQQLGLTHVGATVTVVLNRTLRDAPVFEYSVDFDDGLSDAQKQQLLTIIEKCPVKTTLTMPLRFAHAGG